VDPRSFLTLVDAALDDLPPRQVTRNAQATLIERERERERRRRRRRRRSAAAAAGSTHMHALSSLGL
jgi:hypothetical protein